MEFNIIDDVNIKIECIKNGILVGSCTCYYKNTPLEHDEHIGCIGELVADDIESGVQLINKALEVLEEKHVKVIYGPMNGTTWNQYRCLKYTNGEPEFLLEKVGSKEQNDMFMQAGFDLCYEYSSTKGKIEDAYKSDFLNDLKNELDKNGIVIRNFDKENAEKDLDNIFKVAMYGFSHNPLYTDIPEEVFIIQYSQYVASCDQDFILIAEKDEKAIGFLFAMPDFNEVQVQGKQRPETLILKTIAVLPEYENYSIGSVMLDLVRKRALEKGYIDWIFAFMYKGNTSQRMSKRNNTYLLREYALYKKVL